MWNMNMFSSDDNKSSDMDPVELIQGLGKKFENIRKSRNKLGEELVSLEAVLNELPGAIDTITRKLQEKKTELDETTKKSQAGLEKLRKLRGLDTRSGSAPQDKKEEL
jgi:chromosome segregation ATPase